MSLARELDIYKSLVDLARHGSEEDSIGCGGDVVIAQELIILKRAINRFIVNFPYYEVNLSVNCVGWEMGVCEKQDSFFEI